MRGKVLEKRVKPLAEQVDCKWVEECDVTQDDQIKFGGGESRETFWED